MGKVSINEVKEFKHQVKQNICTLNFSVAFNRVICECNLVTESCKDSFKATLKNSLFVAPTVTKGTIVENAPMVVIPPQVVNNLSPQTGRALKIDATGISLDQGPRGW